MADRIGYVVAVINQASSQVEDCLSSSNLHFDEASAEWERDLRNDEMRETGRRDRYFVCEVIPVGEEASGAV